MDDAARARERLAEAARLRDAEQYPEAAREFATLAAELRDATDPERHAIAAEATLNLGVLLLIGGDVPTALQLYDRVATAYADVPAFALAALTNKGNALMRQGQDAEATTAFEDAASRARALPDRDPDVTDSLVRALQNLGVIRARAGEIERALAAFDEIVDRCEGTPGAPLAEPAAHARYNRAMALRGAGRNDDAIAAYTDISDRYASAPAEDLRHWAGMAQYNKAIHLARMGRMAESVAAAAEMSHRFDDSTDPALRERVGKALFHAAWVAEHAEGTADAIAGYEALLARFPGDQPPMLSRVVAAARRHLQFLRAFTDPNFEAASTTTELDPAVRDAVAKAGEHVAGIVNVIWDGENPADGPRPEPLRLDEVITFLQAPQYEAKDDADLETQNWVFKRKMLRDQLERDLSGHIRAAQTLRAYLDETAPFGLFLRNFDVEGYLTPGAGAPEPIRVSVMFPDEGLLEARLATSLATRVPMIGVGNNAPVRPDFDAWLPRLLLRNEAWQGAVEEIISAASIIVMDVVRLTPGVVWELDTVRRLGQEHRTVVVISDPRETESAAAIAEGVYGARRSPHTPAELNSPELASFPNVVRAADLPEDLAAAPAFADLIANIEQLQAVPPDARPPWHGIVF